MFGGGGGFGGLGGNIARPGSDSGLPFAGLPDEMVPLIERILDEEPEHPQPEVEFSEHDYDRRPLTLRSMFAPFKWSVAGVLVLIVLEVVTGRIGPTITTLAIDKGMGLNQLGQRGDHADKAFLVGIVLAYVVLIGVSILVGYARTLWAGRLNETVIYRLRVRVFSHLQRMSLDFFTDERAGRLMTRMTSDVENLQQSLQEGIVQLLVQGLTLVVLTVQLFFFSVRLAEITLLIVVPCMLAMTVWFQRASNRGYLRVRDRLSDVLADLSESLAGIRLVTAHNRARQNTVNHTNIAGEYFDANDYTARVAALYGPGSEALGNFATLIVVGIGGTMVLNGHMQIGELAGFTLALANFFAPIQQMAQLYNTVQQGNAGVTKLRELLLVEPSVVEARDAVALPELEGRIELDGVSFGYDPTNPVLHDVSLTIEPGQTFSLVGATGAGKSTIAKLVTRFYDPTAGRVLIDGYDLRDVTIESLRRQLGVVPQEPFLFNGTLRDNIVFARTDATDDEVREAADVVGLDDLIARLPEGMDTPVHERGSSLSSGERQLLALARAFLARPRVLVLDEATSSLDLKSEEKVERALDVILEGRTAIIIAHRLATAMRAD
ncbi:MAG TPA: ABC transporter ATP-binding protein, partial [Acidimicrobiales bacterium]|nr:ABC transporter ATP-binding protein [Acidimicrobiales bacterium]